MSKTPADMIAELFAQIGALGKQIDQSADPQAAAAQVAQSLEQLRAVIAAMDAGDDAEMAFAQATAAIAQAREALGTAGGEDKALADLENTLKQDKSADEMAQSLDEQTAGAFSRYRAANEAKAMEEIRQNAKANAEKGAQQVKPNLDFSDVTKREGESKQEDEA